ncbi:polysaccharide biosynthesis protein [Dehalococcoides mccartyi VS]|uniref:Polysaccharide biosynthesis protein n=1 Tax=Dehalococcoides mccartyi (strain VS) TaxID=311424 RepID=D2BGB3_DEHMV|nr:polysaccharide biosynthesis protein [Dehalococcoides mccartyi VS]
MAYIFNKTHLDTSAGMQTGVLKPYRFLEKIRSPLYINAIFLMIADGTGAAFNFVFWILAAHFFTPESVGLAGAVISAMSLLGTISHLGLGFGIIQHSYPKTLLKQSICQMAADKTAAAGNQYFRHLPPP